MNLSSILPPSDLLQQVEGVESGLRRNRRLGTLGWLGVVVAVVQAMVVVIRSGFWDTLTSFGWHELFFGADGEPGLRDQWAFLLALAVLIGSIFVIEWKRYWLKESEAPFRYTFAVDDFTAITSVDPFFVWLRHHLSGRLYDRIGRLSLLESVQTQEPPAPTANGSVSEGRRGAAEPEYDSHVHVGGHYGIRQDLKGWWILEVTPRVRIGPPGSAETLAHTVTFRLNTATKEDGARVKPDSLSADDFDKLVERVYFSVATQIYSQISQDVQHKIDLLPTNYLKATADLHEAQDYARSNTLVAYDESQRLYAEAVKRLDPAARPWPTSWLRWPGDFLRRMMFWIGRRSRWLGAFGWKRLARKELMLGRAYIGYANVILDRRGLAGMSGHRVNPIFEARPMAEKAVRRLKRIPQDVPGAREAEFDARVALALAWMSLGSNRKARAELERARRLLPTRSIGDPRFVYAEGSIESRPRSRQLRFQRATEIDPKFEAAQFALASEAEMVWRTRPGLESDVASSIFEEYERVLAMNPGNIAAWANLGYMRWLLADGPAADAGTRSKRFALAERSKRFALAERTFERGREYKAIKRETFVAEVDYGLARIAAEQGRFAEAHSAFTGALTAHMGQSGSEGYSDSWSSLSYYYFNRMDKPMMDRFGRYRNEVKRLHADPKHDPNVPQRVRDSVLAFVMNDYGEASYNYFRRSCDAAYRDEALDAYGYSTQLDPSYAIPHHNLYLLYKGDEDWTDAGREAELLYKIEPDWSEAKLALMWKRARNAAMKQEEVDTARRDRLTLVHEASSASRAADRDAQRASFAKDPEGQPGPGQAQTYEFVRRAQANTSQAGSKAAAAADLTRRFELLESLAHESRQLAEEILKELLPHEWLWYGRFRATTPERVLLSRWKFWTRLRLKRELRWERELDDIHVKALCEWAWALLTPVGSRLSVSGKIFAHVEEHFWQDNFDILRHFRARMESRLQTVAAGSRVRWSTLRAVPKASTRQPSRSDVSVLSSAVGRLTGVRPEFLDLLRPHLRVRWPWSRDVDIKYQDWIDKYNRILEGTIRAWLEDDPTAYWALSWLDDAHQTIACTKGVQVKARYNTLDPGCRGMFLLQVLDNPGSSPALFGWLGDSLEKLLEQNGSRLALAERLDELAQAIKGGNDGRRDEVLRELEGGEWTGIECGVIRECRRALSSANSKLLLKVVDRFREAGESRGGDEGWPSDDRLREAVEQASELAMRSEDAEVLAELPRRFRDLGSEEMCIKALQKYRDAVSGSSDLSHLWRIADGFKEIAQWKEARKAFRRALDADAGNGADGVTPLHAADRYHVEIARALWGEGRQAEALQQLERVTGGVPGVEEADWALARAGWWTVPEVRWLSAFVQALLDGGEVQSITDYLRLRTWLERSQRGDVGIGNEQVRRDAGHALLLLAGARRGRVDLPWAWRGRFADAPEMQPLVAPIVLEAHSALFEGDSGTLLLRKMLGSDIPDMMADIQTQTGVRIPGVWIRGSKDDAITEKRYTVKLHEIPLAKGKAKGGRRDRTVTEGIEPVVLRYLDTYVGFQEVQGLLEQWRSTATDDDVEEKIARALPDGKARLRFVAVLQRLVREAVPIKDLRAIVKAFMDASSLADADEVVERVRHELRLSLPGNDPGRREVRPDREFVEALERWTLERGGMRILALPRDEVATVQTLVDRLATQLMDGSEPAPVIVVPDHLRRFMRRLMAPRFPFVPVGGEGERRDASAPTGELESSGSEGAAP